MSTADPTSAAPTLSSSAAVPWWRAGRLWAPVALLAVVLAGWELAVRQELISDLILPAPSAIAQAMAGLLTDGLIWPHAWLTLYEALLGFAIGAVLAVAAAVCCALSGLFRVMVYPYMVALQVTPRIAITPILIAWLGFGVAPKAVLAATICFFPVFLNTLTGLMSIDEESLELFRSMGASRWQRFTQLMLPSAAPVTFAGLKSGVSLALLGAVVGEFVSASEGLGVLIQRFSFQLDMAAAFAVLLMLTTLGLLLYGLAEWADRTVVFWSHEERTARKSQRVRARAERHATAPADRRAAA